MVLAKSLIECTHFGLAINIHVEVSKLRVQSFSDKLLIWHVDEVLLLLVEIRLTSQTLIAKTYVNYS